MWYTSVGPSCSSATDCSGHSHLSGKLYLQSSLSPLTWVTDDCPGRCAGVYRCGAVVQSKFSCPLGGNRRARYHIHHHHYPASWRTSYGMAGTHTTYVSCFLRTPPRCLRPPPFSTTSMLIMASRPVERKPTWWHPTFASRTAQDPATPSKSYQLDAGRQVDESTPFWSSHLSGTGDSDCAERARRIARLSLPLVRSLSLHIYVSEANLPHTVCAGLERPRSPPLEFWTEVRDTIYISG